MKEVIEFEDIIRKALARADVSEKVHGILLQDAEAIMSVGGRLTTMEGSRKDQLRVIAERLKAFLPIEKPAETAAQTEPSRCGSCDCCGKTKTLRFVVWTGIDTWACDQCRGSDDDDDDMFDGDADPNEGCPNRSGHEFVEEDTDGNGEGRIYCQHCLADGDA